MENQTIQDRPPKVRKNNRREQILSATEQILRTRGLAGATTREIAKAVGCSEGALYVHFKSRAALLLAVSQRSVPEMLQAVEALKERVGQGDPKECLAAALHGIFAFHQRIIPMLGGLLAEPKLLVAYRKSLGRDFNGPSQLVSLTATYIRGEQAQHRIPDGIDADLAAVMLVSASFFNAFHLHFFGTPIPGTSTDYLDRVVALVTTLPAR